MRIGITTGEALVALGARPTEGEGMASGDVVNTAARLQSAAPVNGILVDEATYRATRQPISYEPKDAIDAKGKAEPVAVWEVIEARSRYGEDVSRSGGAPLVGREHESELLRGALQRARQEESTQLVTLVGVPGIGKSRLVAELFAALDREPDVMYWRQGRCLPYGEGVTYWALAEMIKAHAGILETDSAEQVERSSRRSSRRRWTARQTVSGSKATSGRSSAEPQRSTAGATDSRRPSPPGDDSSKRSPSETR